MKKISLEGKNKKKVEEKEKNDFRIETEE